MSRRRRSPQEKKRLSYRKDRRNVYGENDKSSRKNIARTKRIRHRTERHDGHQRLAAALGPVDEHVETLVEQRLRPVGRRGRRRFPDVRLGDVVENRLATRVRRGMSSADVEQARIARIRRATGGDGRPPGRTW